MFIFSITYLLNAKLHIIFNLILLRVRSLVLPPPYGWWVGRAEKWRSQFLGVELAMRCERSEHGKSQLFIKYICPIFTTVFKVIFIFSSFAILVSNALPFSLPKCAALSRLACNWRLGAGGGYDTVQAGH